MRRRPIRNLVGTAFLLLLGMVITSYAQGPTSFTTLYTFQSNPTYGANDGSYPYGGLLMDAKGNLYGTTYYGGIKGYGTVFKLSPPTRRNSNWSETILYSFGSKTYQADGGHPQSSLVADAGGNLYGITYLGGTASTADGGGYGTVFMITTKGRLTTLYSFTNSCIIGAGCDGSYPYAGVIVDSSRNLYGTTYEGGTYGYGTVFKLSPPARHNGTWSETVLYSFSGGSDGKYPMGGLVMDTQGNLYGTTYGGGTDHCGGGCGVVFKLDATNDYAYSVLYSFGGDFTGASISGYDPHSSLIIDSAGNLYGTTQFGGDYSSGTVFKLDAANGYACHFLYSIATGDGAYPYGAVIMDANGNLYGTTINGGTYGMGTLFKLTFDSTSGNHSHAWTYHLGQQTTDGAYPYGDLIRDASGNLYGVTQSDLTSYGTVFKLTP